MQWIRGFTKSSWRTLAGSLIIISSFFLAYQLWRPGKMFTDGRYDTHQLLQELAVGSDASELIPVVPSAT